MTATVPRPRMNWTCREVLDARMDGAGVQACEVCGTRIRWVHVIEHEGWPVPLDVGRCCAARLCNGYDVEAAEREFRNRQARKQRFLTKGWRQSRRNPENLWRLVNSATSGKVTVTVYCGHDGFYGVCVARPRGEVQFDGSRFEQRTAALNRAFDLIEQLRG